MLQQALKYYSLFFCPLQLSGLRCAAGNYRSLLECDCINAQSSQNLKGRNHVGDKALLSMEPTFQCRAYTIPAILRTSSFYDL